MFFAVSYLDIILAFHLCLPWNPGEKALEGYPGNPYRWIRILQTDNPRIKIAKRVFREDLLDARATFLDSYQHHDYERSLGL